MGILQPREISNYYARPEIVKAILTVAQSREVVAVLPDGTFGKRPNVLLYPNDVTQLVKEGYVEFHGSVEHWSQAMDLSSDKSNYDLLRKSWDMIFDIDGKKFEYARAAALLIVELLEQHGIQNFGVKFSGRRGFHITIPAKAFPGKINFQETRLMYPELPRAIAEYVRDQIKQELLQKLIEIEGSASALMATLEKPAEGLDPFVFVEVEKNWGVRHMFRLPYSLHKSTWNVSLPIDPKRIKDFSMEEAKPENVKGDVTFIKEAEEGEAELLIIEALDRMAKMQKEEKKPLEKKRVYGPMAKLKEESFPASIRKVCSSGFADGRKRALFVLITFLSSAGWDWSEIETYINNWNSKNQPALPLQYVRSQLKWFSRQNRKILPPNYESGIYRELGLQEAETESKVAKNPIVIAFRHSRPQQTKKSRSKKQNMGAKFEEVGIS